MSSCVIYGSVYNQKQHKIGHEMTYEDNPRQDQTKNREKLESATCSCKLPARCQDSFRRAAQYQAAVCMQLHGLATFGREGPRAGAYGSPADFIISLHWELACWPKNTWIEVGPAFKLDGLLCCEGYGYFRPHVRLFDPGWRGPLVSSSRDGLSANYGNDPAGLLTRYFVLPDLSVICTTVLQQQYICMCW